MCLNMALTLFCVVSCKWDCIQSAGTWISFGLQVSFESLTGYFQEETDSLDSFSGSLIFKSLLPNIAKYFQVFFFCIYWTWLIIRTVLFSCN